MLNLPKRGLSELKRYNPKEYAFMRRLLTRLWDSTSLKFKEKIAKKHTTQTRFLDCFEMLLDKGLVKIELERPTRVSVKVYNFKVHQYLPVRIFARYTTKRGSEDASI